MSEKERGEWCASVPKKFLDWLAEGQPVRAPQFLVHKTLMGLWEMYKLGGSEHALEILQKADSWFHRWSGVFSRVQIDVIMNFETG